MFDRGKFTGVVLAGGRGQRMGGLDKGLISYRGVPMAMQVLDVLQTVVDKVLISANRNRDIYESWGVQVVEDLSSGFDGPLAGLLAAMKAVDTPYVLTVPCDTPLLTQEVVERLCRAVEAEKRDLCVASQGDLWHPVFMVAHTRLMDDLKDYLEAGERRVRYWLMRHEPSLVDFSDCPDVFLNINSLEALDQLESKIMIQEASKK